MPDWALGRNRAAENVGAGGQFGTAAETVSQSEVAQNAGLPELRSLLRIAEAVLGARYFDEALEAIAEQAREALNAASVSISRWERAENTLRTLINVGDLGPNEQRWPEDECYQVADDLHIVHLLRDGLPYVSAIDDPSAKPAQHLWLKLVGKESELAVPVMHKDELWGELWVSGTGGRRFGPDDIQLLQAIAAFAAMAIGRAELFSTVWRYAHQDPLTGLANRRELDRVFTEMHWQAMRPALLVCDIDKFKHINDEHGHPTGDALLQEVAAALARACATTEGAVAARLGGDEFCIVMPHSTLTDTERVAQHAQQILTESSGFEVSLSWGAAVYDTQRCSGPALIAAADSALLAAKKHRASRLSSAVVHDASRIKIVTRQNISEEKHPRRADRLVQQFVGRLDEADPRPDTATALQMLAREAQQALAVVAWVLSEVSNGSGLCLLASDLSVHPSADATSSADYATRGIRSVAHLPAAMSVVSGACDGAAFDLSRSDVEVAAVLNELGCQAVLVIGVTDDQHRFLLELFATYDHHQLVASEAHLRVLAHYCTRRAAPPDSPGGAQ